MHPERLPRPLRLSFYALAVGLVLTVCLLPTQRLPTVSVWDKAEHAVTWAGLTLLGLSLAPRRARAIPLFTLGLGVAVELLQALLPVGRSGDPADFLADAFGVAAAVALFRALRVKARP